MLVGASIALAGCTSDGKKDPTPSPSTSGSSPSTSGSPSASESSSPSASISVDIPEAARAHTEAGAIEFAKFAATKAGEAIHKGDASIFLSLTEPTCQGCTAVAAVVKNQKEADERPAQPRIVVNGAQLFGPPEAERVQVDIAATEKAVEVIRANGEVVRIAPEAPFPLRMGLIWTSSGWRIGEMKVIQ